MTAQKIVPEDIAASFQQAVIDVLVQKTLKAVEQKGVYTIALAEEVLPRIVL